jgi:signal transduction histidine kinase/CheY-like chemotaxis protein
MADNGFDIGTFLILTFLSLSVFMLLPRQFHVAVVENNSLKELERARWLFPVYLVAINLFVIPIAVAGILQFGVAANADDYVLLLPILENQTVLALLVFLGGLSAGMAMVVVACVALAIMISNDLIVPAILRFRAQLGREDPINMETNILNIRRAAIFSVLVLAYLYYRVADNSAALASIGLVSFAAVAQLAPAFFGGLIWKNGNARGAMLGMIVGFCVWTYCLLLPTLLPDGTSFVAQGPFELSLLKPQNLFGFDLTPLANGVIWSLLLNSLAYVSGSLSRKSDPLERMQASIFAGFQSPYNRSSGIGSLRINTEELKDTLARYVGKTRTERSFDEYLKKRRAPVPADGTIDDDLLRFSEQLLASSIGASSSRLVHSLLLKRYDEAGSSNFELLDEASKALQFNRDVLQTAMDQLDHGISVFDKDYRLASWNRQFRTMLNLPTHLGQAGIPLAKIIREAVRINQIREDGYVGDDLLKQLVEAQSVWQLTLAKTETVLEIQTSAMPEGGIVIVWHDITEKVLAAKALAEANETLEKRVEERTHELEIAKQLADQANASKTRFLAAAGHDILQPLNAARLYSATMIERSRGEKNGDLADKISLSLSSVEEILASILTISRLDTADHEANIQAFPLKAITEQLEIEFAPIAQQEGLTLTFVHSSAWVNSDRALLRRLLQNLISNALKFTPSGKVLIGCRHRWNGISLEVFDTGIGMTKDQQRLIFREFTRLDNMVDQVPGLGLGLSIVDRIADLLGIKIDVSSQPNEGTRFQLLLEQANAQAMPRSRTTEYRSGRGKLNGMYVLCIDNEQSILDGMAALLEQWGCEVDAALNLQSALEKAKTRGLTPDLVLIDYHLDNSTGIDVMNRLRKNINEHLRGVLITADRTDDVKKMAESLDLTVIHKPVRPAALRAIVTQHSPKSKIAAE